MPWMKIRGERIRDFSVIRISNACRGGYIEGKSTKKRAAKESDE